MKIGALIPIRLASERLPGKALLPICGRPVVHHLLDRVVAAQHIRSPRDVVVTTTEDPSDDPLVAAVEAYGCSAFRGARDDIIKRFHDAIAQFGFDAVIQVDGDDPLTETRFMDRTMKRLLGDPSLGIVWSEGLPLGVNCKSFTAAAMRKVFAHYQSGLNDTGFIYFFTKSGLVKTAIEHADDPADRGPNLRLTLDYPEDFDVFRRVIEALYAPGRVFDVRDAIAWLGDRPDIAAHNKKLDEAYWQRTAQKVKLQFRHPEGDVRLIEF